MEPIFKTAELRIVRGLKNIDSPVQPFNKEYFNSIKQPYLIGNTYIYHQLIKS